MENGKIRRGVAAASATAIAGAALIVGGAGVASAMPTPPATYQVGGVGSPFKITRTVSEATPAYGEVVTVRTEVMRESGGYLLYRVRDFTPTCLEYVPNSARWQATGGDVASEATASGEFSRSSEYVQFANGGGVTARPFWMTAEYTVKCDATQPNTGLNAGGTWIKRAPGGNDELGDRTMGPQISVQRLGTSLLFHQPVNPQVNQQITFNVDANNVPDGSQVAFTANGQPIGSGAVSAGKATLTWTPTSEGVTAIRATVAQTATHGGSSAERTVTVSPVNEDSAVDVGVAGTPKVGQTSQLTASVTPAGAGGTVEFLANGEKIGERAVQADGTATINWIPNAAILTTIDVNFSGRPGVNPSAGAAPAFTVEAADPGAQATSMTLDPVATTTVGGNVSLTATVSPTNATGSVTFTDGDTVIGTAIVTNGVATIQWTPEAEGVRTIRAEFVPSGNFHATEARTQATITPKVVDPVDPDPTDPTGPGAGTGSLGSLTDSLGGGAGGGVGSLSSLGN